MTGADRGGEGTRVSVAGERDKGREKKSKKRNGKFWRTPLPK